MAGESNFLHACDYRDRSLNTRVINELSRVNKAFQPKKFHMDMSLYALR